MDNTVTAAAHHACWVGPVKPTNLMKNWSVYPLRVPSPCVIRIRIHNNNTHNNKKKTNKNTK